MLWNTIYMDAALAQLRSEGFPVQDEDVARDDTWRVKKSPKSTSARPVRIAIIGILT